MVMGKYADSAGTDSRITWLQGVYRGCIWHYPTHYFPTTDGYVKRYSIEAFSASCQVFDTDNDVCRMGWSRCDKHSAPLPLHQSRWSETTMVFKHSVAFSTLSHLVAFKWLEVGSNIYTHTISRQFQRGFRHTWTKDTLIHKFKICAKQPANSSVWHL